MNPVSMIPANGYYACFDTSAERPSVAATPLVCWVLETFEEGDGSHRGSVISGYVIQEEEEGLIAATDYAPRFLGYVYAASSVIAMRRGYEMLTGEPPPAADALARAQNQTFFTAPEE